MTHEGNKQLVASEAIQQCAVSTQTCHLDTWVQNADWGTMRWRATYQPALTDRWQDFSAAGKHQGQGATKIHLSKMIFFSMAEKDFSRYL